MTTRANRNKPVVVCTLDRDVVEWIGRECARRRCKTSQFVNQMLASIMESGQDKTQ